MKRKDFVYIASILLLVQMMFIGVQYGSAASPFIYGVMEGPPEIEPTDAYDSASIDVITQVLEGLYQFNLSSKDMEVTPLLAKSLGTWSADNKSLTIVLKQNVTFHDGTKFNATSVKWNFDRLLDFVLNNKDLQTSTLFLYKNQSILNKTEIIDEYTIKFTLNMPYKIWEKLLGFSATFILKPDDAYKSRFLTLEDDLIGTGPFVYDGYVPDTKTSFSSYAGYHRTPAAITSMVWQIITDSDEKSLAFLNKEIHMPDETLPEYLDKYAADADISIQEVNRTVVYYVQYNMNLIPLNLRNALSYATDTQYIIDSVMLGEAIPLNTPVPAGMAYNKPQTNAPSLNVTKARQYMLAQYPTQCATAGLTINSADADWIAVGNGSTPLASLNFTTHSSTRYKVAQVLASNYLKIGVKMDLPARITWAQFVDKMNGLNGHIKDELTVSMGGWAPDYNDPSNMINPIYRNDSVMNAFQLNDAQLETMMDQLVTTDDGAARQALFEQAQTRIAVDLVPTLYLWQGMGKDVFNNKVITNFPSNVMHITYFYPCTFTAPVTIDGFSVAITWIGMLGMSLFVVLRRMRKH